MKITDEYLLKNPNAHAVLRRFDFEKEEMTSIHYAYPYVMDYLVGMDVPVWMVWPNKEVAEFAADQFTKLYRSVEPCTKEVGLGCIYNLRNDGYDGYDSLYNTRQIQSNWLGAFLIVLAGYNFHNEKTTKINHIKSQIEYWANRVLWGTNGK